MDPMTVTFTPTLCNRNNLFKTKNTRFNSEEIQLYGAESLHGKTINVLIITEHSIAYERYIRLPSNKDKKTTRKSQYNDTKSSIFQSRALSYQWYTTLGYSRCKYEINTKSFILMHQQMYNKPGLSETR